MYRRRRCSVLSPAIILFFYIFSSVLSYKGVILNSNNFDPIVLNKNSNVLVKFYNTGCQPCQSRAPIINGLVMAFMKEDRVVIAAINVKEQEDIAIRYNIQNSSHISQYKFFPKGNKVGEDYDGGGEFEDLLVFMNMKCGTRRNARGQLFPTGDLGNWMKEFSSAKNRTSAYARLEEKVATVKGIDERYLKSYLKYAKRHG